MIRPMTDLPLALSVIWPVVSFTSPMPSMKNP